ncbi:glycine zipper 2TM domain-containing protein [Undibacterium sp. Di24W]|uniref:glycine zipper 2TM domain-containing protein n=1 Tax=Undibacterium sp. Di24W TaxID=3413033 RepID=UPI003BF3EAA8
MKITETGIWSRGLILSVLLFSVSTAYSSTFSQSQTSSYINRKVDPQIQAFSVNEVKRIAPGVELNFSVYGTPGGQASLRIAGATRNLNLLEVDAGEYEGTYTISARDSIAARSQVTANLRIGNQVTSEKLNESLQAGVGYHPKMDSTKNLAIQSFKLDAQDDLNVGNSLNFHLLGNSGARVELTITGVKGKVLLAETGYGEYSVNYIIRSRDRITPNSEVIAYLIMQDRSISQHLGRSLSDRNADRNGVQQTHNGVSKKIACYNCGQVEAINVIETRGEGGYLGTIGGGVIVALLGSQIGNGNGRTAAQIAGAVGGAYAGRAIEGNSRKTSHFEVIIRLQNGASQTLSFANNPGFQVGDQVKVDNGRLIRN